MGMFPDEFPFTKRADEAPVVEATPLAAEAAPSFVAETPVPAAAESAPPAPLPFKDRRRSPRQRLAAKATLRVDNIGGNPLNVEIDNHSLLGVRFRTDRVLPLNDRANIRLEVGPLKWNARLRVISCLDLDGSGTSFHVGCEFVGNELARGRAAA